MVSMGNPHGMVSGSRRCAPLRVPAAPGCPPRVHPPWAAAETGSPAFGAGAAILRVPEAGGTASSLLPVPRAGAASGREGSSSAPSARQMTASALGGKKLRGR